MKRLVALGLLVIAMVSVQIGGATLSATSFVQTQEAAPAIIGDDTSGI